MTLTTICKFHSASKFRMRDWPAGVWWEIDGDKEFLLVNQTKVSIPTVKPKHLTSNDWEVIE